MAEFQWTTEGRRTVIRLAGVEVGEIERPGDRMGDRLNATVDRQRWHGGRSGRVTWIELKTEEEGRRRMTVWLAANRVRLFREVAKAKWPNEQAERALKRLERELRG